MIVPIVLGLALLGLVLSPAIGRQLRWRAMERELEDESRRWRLGL